MEVSDRQPSLCYEDVEDDEDIYLSIVDDGTFPQQMVALTVPTSVEYLPCITLFGSCHGLFCFDAFDDLLEEHAKMAVVWNPSIRKSVVISLLNKDAYVFGFGVCPVTHDIKILMANYHHNPIPDIFKVKAIILSTGPPRISTICVAGESPDMYRSHLVIDRFIYWLVTHSFVIDGESQSFQYIMSFDLTNDEFQIVRLPFNLAVPGSELSLFKLKESLAVVKYDFNINLKGYTAWHMKHGVPNVFINLFTVDLLSPAVKKLLGFRKCGENILEVQDDEDEELAALADYEILYETSMVYEIVGYKTSFYAYSYEETLLLLNHPDSVSLLDLDEDEYELYFE